MKNLTRFLTLFFVLLCVGFSSAQQSKGKMSFGVAGSGLKLVGGRQDDSMIGPFGGITLGYTVAPSLSLELNCGAGWTRPHEPDGILSHFKLRPNSPYRTFLFPLTFNFKLNLKPEARVNPYFGWGYGILFWTLKDVSTDNKYFPVPPSGEKISGRQEESMASFIGGVELFLSENMGIDLSLRYHHLLDQDLDMSGYGDVQSGMFEGRVELNVYLGGWMDTDGDGIEDKQDLSPKEAEDFDGFQDMDGKPDLDNDNDGIPDTDDKSPNEAEDKDGFQDEDGTPDPDNDSDGIPDAQDKAPNDPEDKDGFQDEDGQPDPDNDSDGIPDTNDECPNEPETFNDFEDEDGCPDKKPEVVIDTQAPIVLEGVTFNSGSNVLTPEAKTVLDRVYRTLVDYPEMTVEVRGHTDNTGSYDLNMRLSVYRADAVKSYLVSKGVDSIRINAVGFGPDKPIAPNSTIEGRALNRRIEFIRIK